MRHDALVDCLFFTPQTPGERQREKRRRDGKEEERGREREEEGDKRKERDRMKGVVGIYSKPLAVQNPPPPAAPLATTEA